jgi:hypothetical protein
LDTKSLNTRRNILASAGATLPLLKDWRAATPKSSADGTDSNESATVAYFLFGASTTPKRRSSIRRSQSRKPAGTPY